MSVSQWQQRAGREEQPDTRWNTVDKFVFVYAVKISDFEKCPIYWKGYADGLTKGDLVPD